MDAGRRAHYGAFYGLAPAPWDTPEARDLPAAVVVGNCQAESIRVLLSASGRFAAMRIPPIFEWTAEDCARARDLMARIDVLVIQPVRADYRGLPCGTEQLEALLSAAARSIRIPVLRYAGLHPFHAIVRDPQDSSSDPPIVPYLDLRTISTAADRPTAARLADLEEAEVHAQLAARFADCRPSPAAIRTAAAESIGQLQARQRAHGTVLMDDVLAAAPHWHTINHPATATLMTLAARIIAALDAVPEAVTAAAPVTPSPAAGRPAAETAGLQHPGRELLGGLEAPVRADVAAALDAQLRAGTQETAWERPGTGETTAEAVVAAAQLRHLQQRPHLLQAALRRCAERMEILGLQV